ncbi:MAG: glycosyltransferase involved in cell wall biosynthesis [Litorivivens sp.]|jgi:glycosyltransferase involved in cell wall biosynthesis
MSQKPHLLMVFDQDSTFVRRDVRILSEDYEVVDYHFANKPKWKALLSLVHLFFYIVLNRKFKTVVTQSAGYLSFAPALLGKLGLLKCAIVVIGTDGAKLPEINYGHFVRQPLATFTSASLKMAQLILPVHKSLEQHDYVYDDVKFKQQGFRSFCGTIITPVQEVVNGYDYLKFEKTIEWKDRKRTFLTVAAQLNHVAFKRKGMDLIFQLAELHPEHDFTVVSSLPSDILVPTNVQVLGNVPQDELVSFYNQHKYYFQLSMFEGFPNALCEAMLCGCVPIGSMVAAIPEIIAEEGYVLERKDLDLLSALIQKANGEEKNPREQIKGNFPIERRSKELLHEINQLHK